MPKQRKTKYDAGDSGLPQPPQYDHELVLEVVDAMYSRLDYSDLYVRNIRETFIQAIRTIQRGVPPRPEGRHFLGRHAAFTRFLVKAFPTNHRLWTYFQLSSADF